jgi:hypothetical protein
MLLLCYSKGHVLDYVCHKKQKRVPEIVGPKQLAGKLDQIKKHMPGSHHLWQRYKKIINPTDNNVMNAVRSYPQGP